MDVGSYAAVKRKYESWVGKLPTLQFPRLFGRIDALLDSDDLGSSKRRELLSWMRIHILYQNGTYEQLLRLYAHSSSEMSYSRCDRVIALRTLGTLETLLKLQTETLNSQKELQKLLEEALWRPGEPRCRRGIERF